MSRAAELYLDLLKRCLTRTLFEDSSRMPVVARGGKLQGDVSCGAYDARLRAEGRDWPSEAETMIGLHRLDNLQRCIADVVESGVPGDVLEAGVWRGGASIFMRAALDAYGDEGRTVWAADSFRGLPPPDPERYPADRYLDLSVFDELAISVDEVRGNFARYGLLDDRVRFREGWFEDTLPSAPVERLALLRCDGDLYASTVDTLVPLYPKVSVGGNVRMPGLFELKTPDVTVLDIINKAQGLNEFADKGNIKVIRRGQKGAIDFKYNDAINGKNNANFIVQPGDVIIVN